MCEFANFSDLSRRRQNQYDTIRDPLTAIQMKHGTTTSAAAKHDIRIKICSALNQVLFVLHTHTCIYLLKKCVRVCVF